MKFLNTLLCILIIGLWLIPAPVQAADPIADLLFPFLKPPVDNQIKEDAIYVGASKYVAGQEIIEKRQENSKTTYLGNNKYSLDVSKAPIHYKDNYGSSIEQWKDIDTTIVNGRIDKAPYTAVFDYSNKSVTVTDKKTGSVTTIGMQSLGVTSLSGKGSADVSNNIVTWKDVTTDTDIKIIAENSVIRLQRILKSDKADTKATFSVYQSGIGIKLGYQAQDKALRTEALPMMVTSLSNGILTEDIDKVNAGAITYPLTIDPTLDILVGASADDADVSVEGTYIGLNNAYISFGDEFGGGVTKHSGMRFLGVTIGAGSNITTSYIIFTAQANLAADTIHTIVVAEQNNTAATFSTYANFMGRGLTTAQVNWDFTTDWVTDSTYNTPEIKTVIQELVTDYGGLSGANIVLFVRDNASTDAAYRRPYAYDGSTTKCPKLHIEYITTLPLPTTSTNTTTLVEETTCTMNGQIISGTNVNLRGFAWGTTSNSTQPVNETPPASYTANYTESGTYSAGIFSYNKTGLTSGDRYYVRAYSANATGYGWGSEVSFLTKPAPPTNVLASDGTSTANVTVTWTASANATNYYVLRNGVQISGTLGAVTTYNDTTASPPTVVGGAVTASDGTIVAHVALSVGGESAVDGTHHSYTVRASNATGNSTDAGPNDGWRGTAPLGYQWFRSAADSNAAYTTLGVLAITDPYNDTTAPADGSGRWFLATVNMTGVGSANATATPDRGYRAPAPVVTTQSCTGFGTTWAVVNGDAALGLLTATQQGFEYGLTTAYGETYSTTGAYTSGAFSAYLSPLSKATVYHYRVFSTVGGVTYYGSDMVFSTKGSPVLSNYWNIGGDGDSSKINSANITYQTFTTNTTIIPHSITTVKLMMKRVGVPGIVTAGIRSTSNSTLGQTCWTYPTGVDLASGSLDGSTFTANYTWYTFTMNVETCLSANTTHAIVVQCPDADANNYVMWQLQGTGLYPGGNAGYSVNGGVSWTNNCPEDQLFELWGNPCLEVSDAKVFTSYISTGDWLITCLYKNLYPPYYTEAKDVSQYFVLQLYNTSTGTVIAQTKCFEWGYKPGAIYLSPTMVTSLQWGYAYRVRLYGLFTGNPYAEYVLQPTDWMGSDLTRLDSWVRSCASLMETYYGTALTTYLTDRGIVLNSAGGVIFATDIPQLSVIRPNLFSIVSETTGYTQGEYSQSYQDELVWQVMIGPQMARAFTSVGNTVGVGGATIGSWIGFLIYALVALLCFRPGHAIAAMVIPVPILLIVFGTGLAELALMGILLAVAIIVISWQGWFKGG